jgi:hypothetical protein
MTFKEINIMPPLEMERATYRQIRRALRHSNEHGPKNLSKLPSGWNKRQYGDSQNMEGGEQ